MGRSRRAIGEQTRSPTRSRPAVIPWWRTFRHQSRPRERSGSTATRGKLVPDGWIRDAIGNATNDPNAFYGPPRGGILPLGAAAGHKGFALGLLVEILGSALAGISSQDPQVFGNGVCFFVVDPSAFCPLDEFRRIMDETVAYIKSSQPAPGFEEVLVPGELEFRTLRQRQNDGIPVDAATLEAMREHGARLGVDVDGLPQSGR